jgi:transcriptional regulator with XRE-family HTH domain
MNGTLDRIRTLKRKFKEQKYRENYVAQHLKTFLANQIRALRGAMSQAEFGRLLGKPQSVVSRLESSDYGKVTLQTLLEIAAKRDVALIVRFVSHDTFLQVTQDFSQEAYRPTSYEEERKEQAAKSPTIELSWRTSKPVGDENQIRQIKIRNWKSWEKWSPDPNVLLH